MNYAVTVTSKDGENRKYACGGLTDAEALVYAGKVVEMNASTLDPNSRVIISNDGKPIGTASIVREIIKTKP